MKRRDKMKRRRGETKVRDERKRRIKETKGIEQFMHRERTEENKEKR